MTWGLLGEFEINVEFPLTCPFCVGVKVKPRLQVEPRAIATPQVVALGLTMKCESDVAKGVVRVTDSVPKLLKFCITSGEVWPTRTVPKLIDGFGEVTSRSEPLPLSTTKMSALLSTATLRGLLTCARVARP